MKNTETIIAIDPDVDRSGVAVLTRSTRTLQMQCLPFPKVLELLYRNIKNPSIEVTIEAGWLIHTNWHLSMADNRRTSAAKGMSAGRNHEVGRKIAEMCEYWHIPYRLQQPLRKCWRGKDRKITDAELRLLLQRYKIQLDSKRSNQDGRDACLLAIAQL